MPSVQAAFYDFFKALISIGSVIVNAVFAVFQTILALGQELVTAVVHLFRAVLQLAVDLTQGITGFVLTNFFAIIVIGGAAYWYTQRQGVAVGKGKKQA